MAIKSLPDPDSKEYRCMYRCIPTEKPYIIETPIGLGIYPYIMGSEAIKTNMKEIKEFIKSPKYDWGDWSIDCVKHIITVHKKMSTMELILKIKEAFDRAEFIDDDIPIKLTPMSYKVHMANGWDIQGIDLEAEFFVE